MEQCWQVSIDVCVPPGLHQPWVPGDTVRLCLGAEFGVKVSRESWAWRYLCV